MSNSWEGNNTMIHRKKAQVYHQQINTETYPNSLWEAVRTYEELGCHTIRLDQDRLTRRWHIEATRWIEIGG